MIKSDKIIKDNKWNKNTNIATKEDSFIHDIAKSAKNTSKIIVEIIRGRNEKL